MGDFPRSERAQLAHIFARILGLNVPNLEIIAVDQLDALIGRDFDAAGGKHSDAAFPHNQIVACKSKPRQCIKL